MSGSRSGKEAVGNREMGIVSPKKKTIGVLGGMGPGATAHFFRLLIAATDAASDQEHAPILVWNNPRVPPRTEAILGRGPSALPALLAGLALLERGGAGLVIMPCLTAHHYAPALAAASRVPFVSLIAETLAHARRRIPGLKTAGLLATTGTIQAGLFARPFARAGIEILTPPPREQEAVMAAIREIKAGRATGRPRASVVRAARALIARGAGAVIAGCTEIPLVLRAGDISRPLLDPMSIGARACVRKAGYKAKE
jgi:aspartate racemase